MPLLLLFFELNGGPQYALQLHVNDAAVQVTQGILARASDNRLRYGAGSRHDLEVLTKPEKNAFLPQIVGRQFALQPLP